MGVLDCFVAHSNCASEIQIQPYSFISGRPYPVIPETETNSEMEICRGVFSLFPRGTSGWNGKLVIHTYIRTSNHSRGYKVVS